MSTSYEATGTLIYVGDTEQVKETFKKRSFTIEIADGNYPQQVPFQATQDRTTALDGFKVGDTVSVCFNLRGRPYNGKWFVNLEAWRVTKTGEATAPGTDKTELFHDDVPF